MSVVHAQLEKDIADAGTKLGFTWQAFSPAAPEDYDAIFARLAAQGFDAAYVEPGPLLNENQTRIAALALRHRVPTIGNYSYHAENGLLFAYGEAADPLNERAAEYVDRILAVPSRAIFRLRDRSSSISWSTSRLRRRWELVVPVVLLSANKVIR